MVFDNHIWRGRALRIAVGITMLALLLAGGAGAGPFAYITNGDSNTVSVIDTATNTVTATVNVGLQPIGVAVNPAGTRVYVTNMGSNTVSVINTATNTVTATVNVGINPAGVAVNPAGTKVYVANNGNESKTVSVINTATNTVIATVNVGGEDGVTPFGVAVNPAGTRVYVTNSASNTVMPSHTVSVIDTATNTVTATVNVGIGPCGVAVNPAGTKVYVTNMGSNTVSVIDTATNTVTATVNLGGDGYHFGVAVNPAGTMVYVVNWGSSTVSVINTTTNTVTATVNVGSNPYGVAVNPAGTMVYVTNYYSYTVSVINTATNTVTATVNVGIAPFAFGQFIGPASSIASVTNLTNITYAPSYINWTWTDPADADFEHVEIYLNGTSQGSVAKGVQFFNATSLTPDTQYEIATRTVDVSGNVNLTLVNSTARTSSGTIPVLLVHGWQLFGGFNPALLWETMAVRLTGDSAGSWIGDMKKFSGNGRVVYISNYTHDTTIGTEMPIRYYAKNLAEEIKKIKSEENVSKVDIVAHSMGGLVSRAYIESGDFGVDLYKDDVNKLIMLGTPNHGTYLPFLNPFSGEAEDELETNSNFLNILNHGCINCTEGEDKINTKLQYYTIAGDNARIGDYDDFIFVSSVKLSNVRNFIYPVGHSELRTDSGVYQKVKEILDDSITPLNEQDPIPQQLSIISGKIDPNEEKSHEINVSNAIDIAFSLYWSQGDLNFTITTPHGNLINTSMTEMDRNVTHFKDPELILDEYIIKNPEKGIWKVNIIGADVPVNGENYTVLTLFESLQKYQYDNGTNPTPTNGSVHNINKGTNYTTIQAAINDASPGDEIYVDRGIYYENVNVNKQLTLRGIGMPVVDANGSGSAITLAADGIVLEGFTATGARSYPDKGIVVISNNNRLTDNNASNNDYGIHLYSSSNNRLSSNIANSNTARGIYLQLSSDNNTLSGNTASSNSWDGIYLDSSSNNTLNDNSALNNNYGFTLSSSSNNTLSENNANSNNNIGIELSSSSNNRLINNIANSNNARGISLQLSSDNNTISGNIANSNSWDGIYLDSSSNNTLNDNSATLNNNYGFTLSSSSNNTISGNTASSNSWGGIFLYASSNNRVSGNIANSNNERGITLSSSSDNNTLSSNTAKLNSWDGIYLHSSSNNLIYNNHFNNTNNAQDNGNNIWNTTKTPGTNIIGSSFLGGNFWANPDGSGFSQKCTDGDGDGICDSPYTLGADNIDYLPLTYNITTPTPTPPGTPIESITGAGTVENLIAVNPAELPETPPSAANLNYGIFRFNIPGITSGGSATLTLTFPDILPAGTTYWKYGPNATNSTPHWYTIPSTINGNKITITLVDGGDGDDDRLVNGIIHDDGGPSIPQSPDAIPEFPTIALPILSVLGLMFVLRRRI